MKGRRATKRLSETSLHQLDSKRRRADKQTRRDLKAAFENDRSTDEDSDMSSDGVQSAVRAGMKIVTKDLGAKIDRMSSTIATVLSAQQRRADGGGQLTAAALKEFAVVCVVLLLVS